MKWTYNDQEYDSDSLRVFETGQDYVPRVYLADDGECFVESKRRNEETIPRVRRVGRCEALSMAERFHMTDFKNALVELKHRLADREALGLQPGALLTEDQIRALTEKHQANFVPH